MKCPFCFNDESKVVDSRSTDDNTTIRRRRECTKCNKRYTTYEKIEDIPILVVKRDLTRENFNKEKIVNGLIIACQKRPVSRKQIEDIADDIEKNISNRMLTEVASEYIGEMIMDRLKGRAYLKAFSHVISAAGCEDDCGSGIPFSDYAGQFHTVYAVHINIQKIDWKGAVSHSLQHFTGT